MHPRPRPAGGPAAASYARYSSDSQDASSVAQQQRNCRRRAEADGHPLPAELEFADHATSGTRADRAGLQALLAAARAGRFGVLYVDSLSRLARELAIALPPLKELTAVCGVRVVSVAEGIDSAQGNWELHAVFNSWMHQEHLKTHAAHVRRGREDAVLADRSNGDWCFGYKSEPIPGSELTRRTRIPRKRLVVDPAEADWVRRVFDWFTADRWSLAAIARELTARNAPRDRRAGRARWTEKAVRRLLANRKYVGVWEWGQTVRRRNPLTGRVWQEPRPDGMDGRLVRVRPGLRLVDDDVFARAQELLAAAARRAAGCRRAGGRLHGSAPGGSGGGLLTGVFRCGHCGRPFGAAGPRGYLCCRGRTRPGCTVTAWLNRDLAARVMLDRLGRLLLDDPDWRERVLAEAVAAWERDHAGRPAERAALERARADLAARVGRLVDSIERGIDGPEVRDRLRQRRAELADVDRRLAAAPAAAGPPPTAAFVADRLRSLHEVLAGGGPAANAALRDLVGPVVLTEVVRPHRSAKYLRGSCRVRVGRGLGDGEGVVKLDLEFRDVAAEDARESDLERVRGLVADGWTSARIAAALSRPVYWVEQARSQLRLGERATAERAAGPPAPAAATDLNDGEWAVARVALGLPDPRTRTRGRVPVDRRRVVDAARHKLATGQPWTTLPTHYPRHEFVRQEYLKWQRSGAWGRMQAALARPSVGG